MFVLTIESNDPETIRQTLKTIAAAPLRHDSAGVVHGGRYEYQRMIRQPWKFMADWLHYNADGCTLKAPVYSEKQMRIMDPHGIAGMTPERMLSALENGEFNEKPEPTERDYENSVAGYPV